MTEPTIQFELSIDDVNLILDALGDRPFKTVFALVARLQTQARSQLVDGQLSSEGLSNPAATSEEMEAMP
ncbi:MAG: hypothetical protein VKN13_04850 [Cyanobacteriota bacterium]|nr:hypothetical protein [Cyanobacteriota bacterium]